MGVAVTLKTGLGVRQGHSKRHHSMDNNNNNNNNNNVTITSKAP